MSDNQYDLFVVEESYNIADLRNICYREIRKTLKQLPNQDEDEYEKEIAEEADLLYAEKLRQIADSIEKRILEPQAKEIHAVYGKHFKK